MISMPSDSRDNCGRVNIAVEQDRAHQDLAGDNGLRV